MKQFVIGCLILIACLVSIGCEDSPANYRALRGPSPEWPVVNPPLSIRQKNWLGGPDRDGSCVHASLSSMLHWQNDFAGARQWRATYGGGEYASRLRERLTSAGKKFAYTEKTNLALLDFAHNTRRGALLWWKPSHCCLFCGWVTDPSTGKVYAVILDNNSVGKYELTEREQFHRLWAGYGGFALTVLGDPPSPPPFRSFERIGSTIF